jgi:hypothetical protein
MGIPFRFTILLTEIRPMKPFAQFNDIVSACAEIGQKTAQDQANKGIFEPLYLYFKKSTEQENGQLLLIPDDEKAPEGFELATGEGLRCNVPLSDYWAWIRQRSVRLPILAYGI